MCRVQSAPVSAPAAPSMEVEEDKITDEMLAKMTKKAKESFKTRPKRSIPADLCTEDVMKDWKEVQSYSAHKTTQPTVKVVAQHVSHPNQVLSGGADGQVLLYDVAESKITRRFTGHTKSVNALLWHPDRELVISASDDRSVRLWIDGES